MRKYCHCVSVTMSLCKLLKDLTKKTHNFVVDHAIHGQSELMFYKIKLKRFTAMFTSLFCPSTFSFSVPAQTKIVQSKFYLEDECSVRLRIS